MYAWDVLMKIVLPLASLTNILYTKSSGNCFSNSLRSVGSLKLLALSS